MDNQDAAARADSIIALLITHQPGIFGGPHWLSSKDDPEKVAERLTDLRAQLIEKLKPQEA